MLKYIYFDLCLHNMYCTSEGICVGVCSTCVSPVHWLTCSAPALKVKID